jgi:hypothetical protein
MFGKDISHLLKIKNAKKKLPKAKYILNNEEVYDFLTSLQNGVQDFLPICPYLRRLQSSFIGYVEEVSHQWKHSELI